jgi:hypothetical protein
MLILKSFLTSGKPTELLIVINFIAKRHCSFTQTAQQIPGVALFTMRSSATSVCLLMVLVIGRHPHRFLTRSSENSLRPYRHISCNLCVQTGSGTHPASCTMGTGGPFPGAKARPGRDADHSPPSSAEVVNESFKSFKYSWTEKPNVCRTAATMTVYCVVSGLN